MQTTVTTPTYLSVQQANDLEDAPRVALVMANACFHEQRPRSMASKHLVGLMALVQGLRLNLQGVWGFRRCYHYH